MDPQLLVDELAAHLATLDRVRETRLGGRRTWRVDGRLVAWELQRTR